MNIEASIVIPAYNARKTIGETLFSCYKQRAPEIPFEIIVVNDGSTDNTMSQITAISKQLPRGFLRVFDKDHKNAASSINLGVSEARGKNIILVDADDLLTPCAVDLITTALEKNDVATGEHAGFKVNEKGRAEILYFTHKHQYHNFPDAPDAIPLLHGNIMGHPKTFTKERFERISGEDENFIVSHDYDLMLKMLFPSDDIHWGLVPQLLYWYRSYPNSLSSTKRGIQISEAEIAINRALNRLGISKQALHAGRDKTGYLYFEHLSR